MSIINNVLLKNQEKWQESIQAIYDIANCLHGEKPISGVRIALSAYLLFKVSTNIKPLHFDYNTLLSSDFNLGIDTSIPISEYINSEEWQELYLLSAKYQPDVFALSAYSCEFVSGMKGIYTETTPDSIIRLSQRILNISSKDKVADICCGIGTFLNSSALLEPEAEFFGYDINTSNILISTIRANLVNEKINYIQKDVFTLIEENPVPSFDKIFANYPFKMSLRNIGSGAKFIERYPDFSRATSSDWVFNALICELLSDTGKAIGIMTNGSTWNSIDTPIRKYFVEKGLIESVISLPGRMFNTTSISTSLIVLSKGNKNVRIVDASKICQQGRRYNEFTEENINTIISALNKDSEYSRIISIDELRTNEYTLSLNRYLKKDITFANAVPFESVIKSITRGAPCTARQLDEMISKDITNFQFLMLSNIKNGIIDDNLPYLSYIDTNYEKYCLKHNDLILSKNGYPYKVAIAKVKDGQKILANGNLYIIELDQEKVDPIYLKAFFESEQGIAVLKSITVGATIPNIGIDKLKKVQVPIPPIEDQKRIADVYQAVLDEIAVYKMKLDKAISRLRHVFDEESEG